MYLGVGFRWHILHRTFELPTIFFPAATTMHILLLCDSVLIIVLLHKLVFFLIVVHDYRRGTCDIDIIMTRISS
jgi:hypothetical protein